MTEEVKDVKDEQKEDVKPSEGDQQSEPELSPLEQQAQSFGWMPKEKWVEAGHDEADWTPAKHFMKFGELKKQVVEKEKALTKQEKLIKAMKNYHLTVKQAAYEEALKTLRAEREAAFEEGDMIKAERLRDKIDETKEKAAKDRALPPEIEQIEKEPVQSSSPPPEFFDFLDRNPWYISDVSKQDELSKEADKIGMAEALAMQHAGQEVKPDEVYKAVEKKIRKLYPEKFEKPNSPQQSSSRASDKGTGKAPKLSEEEQSIAKSFGLTPEQYLEGLKGYKGR